MTLLWTRAMVWNWITACTLLLSTIKLLTWAGVYRAGRLVSQTLQGTFSIILRMGEWWCLSPPANTMNKLTERQQWGCVWLTWAGFFIAAEAKALATEHPHAPLSAHLRWVLGVHRKSKLGKA